MKFTSALLIRKGVCHVQPQPERVLATNVPEPSARKFAWRVLKTGGASALLIAVTAIVPCGGFCLEVSPSGCGVFQVSHWKQVEFNVSSKTDSNIDNPYVRGVFIELPWAALEPQKGRIDTRILDAELSIWNAKGKTIILNIKTAGRPRSLAVEEQFDP